MNRLSYYIISAIISVSAIGLFVNQSAQAEDFLFLRQIKYPLAHEFNLISPNGEVELQVFTTSTQQTLLVKLMQIVGRKRINKYFTYTSDLEPASDLYFLKFKNIGEASKEIPEFTKPAKITVKYEVDNKYKEIYYYNWMNLRFEKVKTVRDTLNKTLTFEVLAKKSMMFAVFSEPELVGRASWYIYPKYRGELITASRDFAEGAQLKVTNLYNDKQVVVTVRDYGPKRCADWTEREQRLMGPCQERILDLSKTAFLELATSTGQGIISEIMVEAVE